MLKPDQPDDPFHLDVLYNEIMLLGKRLLENLNFVTKIVIIWATYEAS